MAGEETDAWAIVGAAPFVAMTTYRRTGEGVTTPVWIAAIGPALVMTTEASVGKVKRLRNSSRVTLQPCTRFGRIEPGAVTVEGDGVILGANESQPREVAALRRKYGLQYSVITGVERLIRQRQHRAAARLIIWITPRS